MHSNLVKEMCMCVSLHVYVCDVRKQRRTDATLHTYSNMTLGTICARVCSNIDLVDFICLFFY